MSPTGPKNDDGVLLAPKPAQKAAYERRYRVVFHNDDYTTRWFVVHVLQQVFRMSETAAVAFTMAVHRKGRGVAGVYARDIAETKAETCMDLAAEFEMPLMVTAEPEDDDNR
ncbi:MAG: ATP-dependent Clp protease adaptor ClpS [Polyangiaceae bacterium]